VEQQLSIFVANTRKAIVNREYILRMNRPFLWLEGGLRIQVSREQWPLLTSES
jgi:two-component system regulatory protein